MVNKIERSLTWKYFWQQKTKELLIVPTVIFIGYFLAIMTRWFEVYTNDKFGFELTCETLSGWCWLSYGILGLLLLILVTLVSGIVLFIGFVFINSNWQRAKKRAKEEVRKTKRDAKKNK